MQLPLRTIFYQHVAFFLRLISIMHRTRPSRSLFNKLTSLLIILIVCLDGHKREAQKLAIDDVFMEEMLENFARDDFYGLMESAMLEVSQFSYANIDYSMIFRYRRFTIPLGTIS